MKASEGWIQTVFLVCETEVFLHNKPHWLAPFIPLHYLCKLDAGPWCYQSSVNKCFTHLTNTESVTQLAGRLGCRLTCPRSSHEASIIALKSLLHSPHLQLHWRPLMQPANQSLSCSSVNRLKSKSTSKPLGGAASSQSSSHPATEPPPVPANLVRNQLRLCLLSSPCLQLICSSLMQLSCVLRAERHNKVIRLIRLAAPLLSPYAHYTYSIRCVMRFCTPSTRCCYVCAGVCVRMWKSVCIYVYVWKYESVCVCVCLSKRASVLAEEICSIYILSLAWYKCALELSAPVSLSCKHFTLAGDHSNMHVHTHTHAWVRHFSK